MNQVGNACHKHFPTKELAEAFIRDWIESVADIYRKEIKRELDSRDAKPQYLGSIVARLFNPPLPVKKEEDEDEAKGEFGDDTAGEETVSEVRRNCLADIYRAEIKRQLDKGARPRDLSFDVTSLFQASTIDGENCHGVDSLKLENLRIK